MDPDSVGPAQKSRYRFLVSEWLIFIPQLTVLRFLLGSLFNCILNMFLFAFAKFRASIICNSKIYTKIFIFKINTNKKFKTLRFFSKISKIKINIFDDFLVWDQIGMILVVWRATSITRQMPKWTVNFKLQFFPICIHIHQPHLNLSKPDTDILNVKF